MENQNNDDLPSMRQIGDIISNPATRESSPRPKLKKDKENNSDMGRYSTIFHGVTAQLNLNTSLKLTVFANIGGLSRGKNYCVLNYEKLAFYSGCDETGLLDTLGEFEANGLIERGEDYLHRLGWRLTKEVRGIIEPIRAELNRLRGKKYASQKHN
ncbi:MAG: hypothetical protein V1704_02390 [Candidatus Vogelbacteria bacterium]